MKRWNSKALRITCQWIASKKRGTKPMKSRTKKAGRSSLKCWLTHRRSCTERRGRNGIKRSRDQCMFQWLTPGRPSEPLTSTTTTQWIGRNWNFYCMFMKISKCPISSGSSRSSLCSMRIIRVRSLWRNGCISFALIMKTKKSTHLDRICDSSSRSLIKITGILIIIITICYYLLVALCKLKN